MTMFRIDDSGIKQLESELKTFAARALPFATKSTINGAAFAGQKIAREVIKREMVTRNRFTVQSVQVEQARTLRISNQSATLGSTADYMEDQEFGGTKTKTGKHGVAIATSEASGEGPSVVPRQRLPRKANSLQQIRLGKRKGKRLSTIGKIRQAKAEGRKFLFLDVGRNTGIYRVKGTKRRPKIRKLYNLSRKSVRIPRNPWLKPAVDETQKLIPGIYKESLQFQLKRLGILGR